MNKIQKLKKLLNLLRQDIYIGKRYDSNLMAMQYIGYSFGTIMFGFVIYNHIVNFKTAEIGCALLAIGFYSIGLIARTKKHRSVCIWICIILTSLIITRYAIGGTNNGFAILWVLLIPVPLMYLAGILYGLINCLYFETLFIILFYTPIRKLYMQGKYTEVFMDRFPILFFSSVVVFGCAMVQYHLISLKQIQYEKQLKEEVILQTQTAEARKAKIDRLSSQLVEALVNAIDAKDKYTNGHSKRVAKYAKQLALMCGYSEEIADNIYITGLLHDIGKIGVPDEIINKPGKLNDDEYLAIKSHPTVGYEILKNINDIYDVAVGAHWHHERYDGKGYPDGIAGEDIPLSARIIAVADSYDAMTSNRSYRNYLPQDVVRQEIINGKGTQFDPQIAEYMIQLINQDITYNMHE